MKAIDLRRFIEAQDYGDSYQTALEEIRCGYKCTHWIWYVFPQLEGLGHSAMSRKFAIHSLSEAEAYLGNAVLNHRLREITTTLLGHAATRRITDMMSRIDAVKVRSCMTLFDIVSPNDIYARVLDAFFGSERCQMTEDFVKMNKELSEGR